MLSLTGLTVSEFDSFLTIFKYEWDEYYAHLHLMAKFDNGFPTIVKPAKYP